MKKTIKIALIVLAAYFCLMGVLSLFSGSLINKYVLPEAETLLGVDVEIDSASLNLLSGSFTARGLAVRNPKGYEEGHFVTADKAAVRVALLPLLRRRIVVRSASLRKFTLHIVRNSSGDFNATYFAERLRVEEEAEDSKADQKEEKVFVPDWKVKRLKADIALRYVDHAFTTNVLDYSFETKVTIDDLSNYGRNDDYGTVSVNSHFVNNPKILTAVLSARVATLSDPLKPTFDANGNVKSEHIEQLDDLAREIGIYCKSFTVDTPFKCTEGRLRGDLKLTLHEPTPLGKLARKIKNVQLPSVLTVTVPVRGTVEKPRIDWTGAILQSLLDNALENVGAAIEKIDFSQEKVQKELDNVVDSFKGLFKKKEKK